MVSVLTIYSNNSVFKVFKWANEVGRGKKGKGNNSVLRASRFVVGPVLLLALFRAIANLATFGALLQLNTLIFASGTLHSLCLLSSFVSC